MPVHGFRLMNVAIVIPARNEERTIADVISSARTYGDVIVVDDGSDDGTYEIAIQHGATVLKHVVNLGKGAALKTGCEYALMNGASSIVTIDADAQHDPKLIPTFLMRIKNCDIVFGYRMFSQAMPFVFRFGNRFINLCARILYGVDLRDTQCGYRCFTSDAYQKIRWRSYDYAVESEMITHVGRRKMRYAQVPVRTIYLDRNKGTTILDGIKIVAKMLWWRVN